MEAEGLDREGISKEVTPKRRPEVQKKVLMKKGHALTDLRVFALVLFPLCWEEGYSHILSSSPSTLLLQVKWAMFYKQQVAILESYN